MNKCDILLLTNPNSKSAADLKKFLENDLFNFSYNTIYDIKSVKAIDFPALKSSMSGAHIMFALDPTTPTDIRNVSIAQALNFRVYIVADPRKLNWLLESPGIIVIPKTGYQLNRLLEYFEEELYGENPFNTGKL